MSIDKKISSLPSEKQKEFTERLMDIVYDEWWLTNHKMDYIDPDVLKIKEILFKEEYGSYLPLPKN